MIYLDLISDLNRDKYKNWNKIFNFDRILKVEFNMKTTENLQRVE